MGLLPVFRKNTVEPLTGLRWGPARDRAAPPFIANSLSSSPILQLTHYGQTIATGHCLTPCELAGQRPSQPRTVACLGPLPATTASRVHLTLNIYNSLPTLPASSRSPSNEIGTRPSFAPRKIAIGRWWNACPRSPISPNSAPADPGIT